MNQIFGLIGRSIKDYRNVMRHSSTKEQSRIALAEALSATEKYAESLKLLNQMSQALNEARSEAQVFDVVSQWAAKIVHADRVCLALLPTNHEDSEVDSLTVFALHGITEPVPTGTKLPLHEVAVGQPIKTKRMIYSADNRIGDYTDIQILYQAGLLSTVSAPLLTSGRIVGTLNICSTKINAFDEQDRRIVEQMAALIATMLENRWLYEEAKRASATKSLFLSNMTHELRTPMNAVLGMASVLQDTELTEEQSEYIDMIQASGRQLLNIINDVLDFSKIEANKLDLEKVAFNVKETIEETIELFRVTIAAKELTLTYVIDEDAPKWIIQDVTRLRQVLTNLLSNAIKFTEAGKVEMAVTAKHIEDCRYVLQISVKDTGIGIAPHRVKNLFQSFSQADASTTRKYGGSGLGLSISKQLCELMGGEMCVQSELGVGSNFTFTFVAERTHCQRHLITEVKNDVVEKNRIFFDRDMAQKHPLKILLAEDNVVNQKVALNILARFGYKADIAANGIEALTALARQHYDVVLMDVFMPEMDGIEATRRIRRQKQMIQQPTIIAVTANAMEQHREEYLAVGMDEYITKPISISELIDALERVPSARPSL